MNNNALLQSKSKAIYLSDKAQYVFIFIIILITANCLVIITDEFLSVLFVITLFIFLLNRKNFDKIILYAIAGWSLINLISFINNQTSFSLWTFTGFIIKMLYPYFIVKNIGGTFFEKLERVIYILTFISLPLFALQMLFPDFINIFNPVLRHITSDEMITDRGWYGIIFRINGSAPDRNSGFMWEPGAFAFMLLLALIYRILRFGLKISSKNLVYIIALFTTFSTMAYIGITILLFTYTFNSNRIGIAFLTVPLAVIYICLVKDLDFMLPKINNYIITLGHSFIPSGQSYLKVNRLAFVSFTIRQSVLWPFGYGIVPSKYMYSEYNKTMLDGVGTIAKLLLYWGWFGLTFFIAAIYKYLKSLQLKTDRKLLIISVVILIVALFSNPFEKSPILYSIVFYPFIFKNNLVKKYVQ